jgi:NitT/TauT family transport system substrate-binding protein
MNRNKGKMKRTKAYAGLLVLALTALAACGSDGADSGTTLPVELTPVALQMDFLAEPGWGLPLYGIDQGIFARHGIDLELIPGQGSQFSMQQLNENEVQFAQANLIAYLSSRAEADSETMAVFATLDHPQAGIITTTPAETLEDLDGTTIGMIPFSVSQILLPLVLAENGLDPNSVTIESVQYSPALMFEGTVDGLEAFLGGNVATIQAAAEAAGIDVFHLDLHDFGLEGYQDTLIVRNELLETDPDLVGRMVAAMQESVVASLEASPDEIADLVLEVAPEIARESVIAEWEDYRELFNESGLIDEAVVETNLRYVTDGLGIQHDLQASEVYTNEFVPTD